MAKAKNNTDDIKEPSIVIRPLTRFGGLDNIHIALLALVVILILFTLVISYTKQITITNATSTNQSCAYGASNGTCFMPQHNASQILSLSKRILASYNNLNNSLSLLPYYTNVNSMNASYVPAIKSWYVHMQVINPTNSTSTFTFSFLISDLDTSSVTVLQQQVKPSTISNNYVASQGVIKISGRSTCSGTSPTSAYWFIDPYTPGSISSLSNLTTIQARYGSKANITLKILYGQYSQSIGDQFGVNNSRALGRYLLCASEQPRFPSFVQALQSVYTNGYTSPSTLSAISNSSGMNVSNINSCISSSGAAINNQALLALYYNVTSTPGLSPIASIFRYRRQPAQHSAMLTAICAKLSEAAYLGAQHCEISLNIGS
jgi:hypothetical protein